MGQPRFYGEYPIIDSPSRPRAKLAVDDRCIYMLKRVGGTAPATSMKIVCAARDGSGDYEVDMSHPGGGGVFTDPWAIAVDESVRWSPEAWLYYVDPTAGQIVATHRPMLAR